MFTVATQNVNCVVVFTLHSHFNGNIKPFYSLRHISEKKNRPAKNIWHSMTFSLDWNDRIAHSFSGYYPWYYRYCWYINYRGHGTIFQWICNERHIFFPARKMCLQNGCLLRTIRLALESIKQWLSTLHKQGTRQSIHWPCTATDNYWTRLIHRCLLIISYMHVL